MSTTSGHPPLNGARWTILLALAPFELSKVVLKHVPPRMIANLRNVNEELAERIAAGIGIDLPRKADAKTKVLDLDPSPALSIQKNMKKTLQGRKVGILY